MNGEPDQRFGGKVLQVPVGSFVFEVPDANGRSALTLKFRVDESSMRVTVEGEDCPGTLLLVTSLFDRRGVNVESCHGRRLSLTQGSQFELEYSPENCEKVFLMLRDVPRHFGGVTLLPPVAFDRVVSVRVNMAKDAPGLLTPFARVLAERRVNLHSFNAEKRLLGQLLGRSEVTVLAEMEVPVGLNLDVLKAELKAVCPRGSQLDFRDEFSLLDDGDAVEAGVLVGV